MYKFLLLGATIVGIGIGAFKILKSKKNENTEQPMEQQPAMG